MPEFDTYLSPFTWRYGTPDMRCLWSEENKRRIWRQLWVTLAEVQAEFGLVSAEQAADLRLHMGEIDLPRALEIEAEIQHDLMAELQVFALQAPLGGPILHLGATSMDIEDNADALRIVQGLDLLLSALDGVLKSLAGLIEAWAETPLIAYTHLQPAEPSTLGYRLACYGQDLLADQAALRRVNQTLRGKGFKGAVGSGAAYAELLGAENLEAFEARLAEKLKLPFWPVTTQVYPRRQDYELACVLAGLAASLHKFAFDLRVLQSPALGELAEPFGERQVGSSAMPFKRNPIRAEKINSLARYLALLPRLAWDNAANSLLERTLDDSANRRILLPEAFLAADELLRTMQSILSRLRVNEASIARNLATYGPFAATERLLMALVKAGADRQVMHARIRQHAMAAWEALQGGSENPLLALLLGDADLKGFLPATQLRQLMESGAHLGNAPARARAMAEQIRRAL